MNLCLAQNKTHMLQDTSKSIELEVQTNLEIAKWEQVEVLKDTIKIAELILTNQEAELQLPAFSHCQKKTF